MNLPLWPFANNFENRNSRLMFPTHNTKTLRLLFDVLLQAATNTALIKTEEFQVRCQNAR